MSETEQLYLGLKTGSSDSETSFQKVLDYIREIAPSEAAKGRFFERLMRRYFGGRPSFKCRFSDGWLCKEWAQLRLSGSLAVML